MAGQEKIPPTDMGPHLATYGSVTALLKWGTIGCFLVAAIVVWIIA